MFHVVTSTTTREHVVSHSCILYFESCTHTEAHTAQAQSSNAQGSTQYTMSKHNTQYMHTHTHTIHETQNRDPTQHNAQ